MTRTYPGADIGSDHDLMLETFKLKLNSKGKAKSPRLHFDLEKLKDPNISETCRAQIGGKFAALTLIDNDVDTMANSLKEVLVSTAEEVLGRKCRTIQPWVTNEVLDLCDKRRELRKRKFGSNVAMENYQLANKAVRKKMKEAKEKWIDDQCVAIEQGMSSGKSKQAFSTLKMLTKAFQPFTMCAADLKEQRQAIPVWTGLQLILLILLLPTTYASNGDRSYIFSKCLQRCRQINCTNLEAFSQRQPLHMKLFRWTCEDECKYDCMWTTVDAFSLDGSNVPQFYGKWPFVRCIGVQEPASMVFSLLNALCHLTILLYRSKVPPSTPMYFVWHGMAMKLDYFSAFALVLYNIFTLLCRVIGTEHILYIAVSASTLMGLYFYHIYYLAFVHFDYGYNMIMNISAGFVNALGWIAWCFYYRRRRPYVWKCVTVLVGLLAFLSLELGDFPPLLWIYDAHALWHAGTVPMTLLWYSFVIDDALHMAISDEKDVKKMA
ncbi:post-GPI attachment to proteins factor 3-like [Elysia marginata]|uniref:Post-GPI attachment to proteins factor 3 n=1 Tax=Elysia marginata TaxID=1093978 RepID=A0AAV4F4J7_9GAST|nr:post-GPI attachment to proteins factor 3-like [Elysia marginata]